MILGIDLGTTKSTYGIWKNGKPQVLPDDYDNISIPSVVMVSSNGKIFVGNPALKHKDRYKGKSLTINSIKRLIGKQGETSWGWLKTYPQELSAFILSEILYQAEKNLGSMPTEAVIAIPSHFDENQRRATIESAEITGLKVRRLLNEATAIGLAHKLYERRDLETILILDCGGGTTDISIMEVGGGVIEVKCIEGDSKLGGDDFDKLIIDHILQMVKNYHHIEPEMTLLQDLVLKEAAERVKIELSNSKSSRFYLPGFFCIKGQYENLEISLNRNTFEGLSQKLMDRIIVLIDRAIRTAGLKPQEISTILLAGGCSRIPIVEKKIMEKFGIKPFIETDIKTSVAKGAIIYSAMLTGEIKDALVIDVLPSSYGIGLKENSFNKMIPKDTTIPVSKVEVFTTSKDFQNEISVDIFQGESDSLSENTFLGSIQIRDIPPAKAGIPQIEVAFNVDSNMTIQVSAKDKATQQNSNMIIKSPHGLNEIQKKLMRKKLGKWKLSRHSLIHKDQIDNLVWSIQNLLDSHKRYLEHIEIVELEGFLCGLGKLDNKADYPEEIEAIISSISSSLNKSEQRINGYEILINKAQELISNIGTINAPMYTNYITTPNFTNQGAALLKDYINRIVPYAELLKMHTAVNKSYLDLITGIITNMVNEIKKIANTDIIKQEIRNLDFLKDYSFPIKKDLRKLKEHEDISKLGELILSIDKDSQGNIIESVIEIIGYDIELLRSFMIIVFPCLELYESIPLSSLTKYDIVANIYSYALFNTLDNSIDKNFRQRVSEIIGHHLPTKEFLQTVVDRINCESDKKVLDNLLKYLKRHKNVDPMILTALLRNKDNDILLYALENIEHLSTETFLPIDICLTHSENNKIRCKAFKIVFFYHDRYQEIEDLFYSALRDKSEEIRLLALDFFSRKKDSSLVSQILLVLNSKEDENFKAKCLNVLSDLKEDRLFPFLWDAMLSENSDFSKAAQICIQKNIDLIDKHQAKFYDLAIRVINKKHSLGIIEKVFLWFFLRRYPEMSTFVERLKEYDKTVKPKV